jgi:hypothetical protein
MLLLKNHSNQKYQHIFVMTIIEYGDISEAKLLLEEVSKLLEAYYNAPLSDD